MTTIINAKFNLYALQIMANKYFKFHNRFDLVFWGDNNNKFHQIGGYKGYASLHPHNLILIFNTIFIQCLVNS